MAYKVICVSTFFVCSSKRMPPVKNVDWKGISCDLLHIILITLLEFMHYIEYVLSVGKRLCLESFL